MPATPLGLARRDRSAQGSSQARNPGLRGAIPLGFQLDDAKCVFEPESSAVFEPTRRIESASRRRAEAALWRGAAKAEGLARSKTCRYFHGYPENWKVRRLPNPGTLPGRGSTGVSPSRTKRGARLNQCLHAKRCPFWTGSSWEDDRDLRVNKAGPKENQILREFEPQPGG